MLLTMINLEREIKLLERHIIVLKKIIEKEPIGIMKLSKEVKIPMHQVRYSMRILQESGFLSPTTRGAMTNTKARFFLKEFEQHKNRLIKRLKRV